MSNLVKLIAGAALLGGVAAGGYWYGMQHADAGSDASAPAARKPLYYRNPMGLPDTSPVPKKDAMGMDYVPVYAGEEASASTLVISPDRVQKLGVRSESAELRPLLRTLRLNGRIEVDERRIHAIAPKFEGWVERLHVDATGLAVRKGQPLFEAYSPELVSALREQALAAQGLAAVQDADEEARAAMQRLTEASAARLKNWDIAGAQADPASRRVTLGAPVDGVVLEKKALAGMRFMPGEELFRIADLSTLWLIAEVPEQDSALVRRGQTVEIDSDASPGRRIQGRVDFIYPTLNEATRTVPVRIVISGAGTALKPGMYAQARLETGTRQPVLSVPLAAVIDSGTRQVVLVQLDQGRYEPRPVTLGMRGDEQVEVLSGLAAGERVVTAANFLLDAESNLKAALGGLHAHASPAGAPAARVAHQARGRLEAVNADGSLSITHEPIPALGWPEMTMDFALADGALARGIAPGNTISFEIVERGRGEWVITRLDAVSGESSHAEHSH